MADKRDVRRRVLGALFLAAAVVLLFAGQTILKEWLQARPVAFLIFWLVCFLFVGLALLTALLDLAMMRRRVRDEQRELFEETLEKIERTKAEQRGGSSETGNSN